ncbi:MAG: FmdE family protein, partial [Thermodesulfobacteriota bacterium]
MTASVLEKELEKARSLHGHLCPGTVIGVRMGLAGLKEINITDPRGSQRKDIIIFVESDRCAIDAIQSVSGCRLSSRTLKFYDYGKMAATFLNLRTSKAVRVVCPESTRDLVDVYCPDGIKNAKEKAVEAYKVMPED